MKIKGYNEHDCTVKIMHRNGKISLVNVKR